MLRCLFYTVSKAAQAADRHARRFELVTKATDVHFQCVGRRFGLVRKNGIEQRLLAHNPARTRHENSKDRKLTGGKLDGRLAQEGLPACGIELELTDLLSLRSFIATSQQRSQSCFELTERERFDEVVI